MAGDKGFKRSEGMNQDDKMENERGKTEIGDEGDHGWAPDSGTGHSSGKRPPGEETTEQTAETRDRT